MENQKRLVAINDISGFGKCSLTVALPIISVAGVVNSKNSTKRKMKKLAKKSVKTMDGILDNVQYMFK